MNRSAPSKFRGASRLVRAQVTATTRTSATRRRRAATARRLGQAAEGANAGSPILLPALLQASTVACNAANPLDGRIATVVAAVPHDAVGPRPLPVHRYTVERVVKGRTRKVVEAELEVTFGPLLGSLTIKPFTSCPAGRSPIDRGRSLHRTGRGRIEGKRYRLQARWCETTR